MPRLEPDLDDDLDTQLNGLDACPLVPNQTTNNEDGAAEVDDCDLCPQIASASETGGDPDCDNIGAACDPDSTVLHDRRFHGFGAGTEVIFDDPITDGVVRDGAVHMLLTAMNTSSAYRIRTAAALAARYEVSGMLDEATVANYWEISLSVATLDEGRRYELMIFKFSDLLNVVVLNDHVAVPGTMQRVPIKPTTAMRFFLQADIVDGALAGVARINDTTVTIPPVSLPPMTSPIRYGVMSYRDPVATATELVTDYFAYTTVRP